MTAHRPFAAFRPFVLAAAAPVVRVADPAANVDGILEVLEPLGGADAVVLPELALTGYTCEDLFTQSALLDAAVEGLLATRGRSPARRTTHRRGPAAGRREPPL